MKRPGPIAYLFGNPLSVIALLVAFGFAGYQWWFTGWSLWAPFLMLLALSYAMRASDQLAKFNRWQREWQAMEGVAPRATLARLAPSWRTLGGIAGVGLAIFLLIAMPNAPDTQIAKGAIILALATALVVRIYRFFRKGRRAKPAAVRNVVVAQCLSVPRQSTNLKQAYSALPAYCATLLRP